MPKISVLGAGSWGTALAILLSRNNHPVRLWGHHPLHMAALAKERMNQRYLPGTRFPADLVIDSSLQDNVSDADIIILAVPSHAFRKTLLALKDTLKPNCKVAWATKGLEMETGQLLHTVVETILGKGTPSAVLSGPTFAGEVASGQPTAITVASECNEFAETLVNLLHNNHFRPYSSRDMIGVQLGGAIKNVLAIAAGLAEGLGFGANARAALITRGLAEMMRLGVSMGGQPDTLMGLSGVGDLILTCTDNQSRNRRFGLGLGLGQPTEAVIESIGQEIEGIPTARLIHQLANRLNIDMPISTQVFRILYEGLPPTEAVKNLLIRDPKPEVMRS